MFRRTSALIVAALLAMPASATWVSNRPMKEFGSDVTFWFNGDGTLGATYAMSGGECNSQGDTTGGGETLSGVTFGLPASTTTACVTGGSCMERNAGADSALEFDIDGSVIDFDSTTGWTYTVCFQYQQAPASPNSGGDDPDNNVLTNFLDAGETHGCSLQPNHFLSDSDASDFGGTCTTNGAGGDPRTFYSDSGGDETTAGNSCTKPACSGGANDGDPCINDASCGAGTCEPDATDPCSCDLQDDTPYCAVITAVTTGTTLSRTGVVYEADSSLKFTQVCSWSLDTTDATARPSNTADRIEIGPYSATGTDDDFDIHIDKVVITSDDDTPNIRFLARANKPQGACP